MTYEINTESWIHKIEPAEYQDPDSQFVLVDRLHQMILRSEDSLRDLLTYFRSLGADTRGLWFGRTSRNGYLCQLTEQQKQKLADMDSGTIVVDVQGNRG